MKSFTISIPDNKENIFIEMMKSISFVKKIRAESVTDISQEHIEIVRGRIQRLEKQPENHLSWKDLENKINL